MKKLKIKNQSNSLTLEKLGNPEKIIKYLQIGTNIPVWEEFHKYIIHDLELFNANSWLIKQQGNIIGHILIYEYENTLYFGYLNILDNDPNKIQFIIDKLFFYAKRKKLKTIKGPINIPSIIFGWGFLEKGSEMNLFLGKPINSSIYQEKFIQNGYSIVNKQNSWEGELKNFPKNPLKNYNFDGYELIIPKDWEEFLIYKEVYKDLTSRNLKKSSIITPATAQLFENYFNFAKKYGKPILTMFLRELKSNKIIGCLACTNNPFRKNINGTYDSFFLNSIVVNKEYRGKRLANLMFYSIVEKAIANNMKYFSSFVVSNQQISRLLNLINTRTHLILESKL